MAIDLVVPIVAAALLVVIFLERRDAEEHELARRALIRWVGGAVVLAGAAAFAIEPLVAAVTPMGRSMLATVPAQTVGYGSAVAEVAGWLLSALGYAG